jgi:UDP-glucuronate 4-epimerase
MADPADWAAQVGGEVPVLVTGAAGFIGFHLAGRLLGAGVPVVGIDNLSPYYDVALKEARLRLLRQHAGFRFARLDLADRAGLGRLFDRHRFRHVVNLAAQAGVRHSLVAPHAYAEANVTGFLNLLEECRRAGVAHLVYASSSSVYGGNTRLPFSVHDNVDHPVSLYAATKKAGELMAHSYSHLFGLPATGLRFFTVYGPWGRPDMAYYLFTKALFEGRPIRLFNHGRMRRDFTYVDDIVEGVARVIPLAPRPDPGFDTAAPDPGRSWAPHRLYNIGNARPEELTGLIAILEELTGRKAVIEMAEMQPGDVPATFADVSDLEAAVGFRPATPLREGLSRFVAWYREFHGV